MEKIKMLYLVFFVIAGTLLLSSVNALAVSEKVRHHMVRGQTAMEMAKIPADYELAIEEFKKAQVLAPNWPDVYYNLGMAQEKAGKFKVAAQSFKRYLQLAPKAPNAASIKDLITRLEFKAEQEITDDVALEIFASLGDSNIWEIKGTGPIYTRGMMISGRAGNQIVVSYQAGTHGKRTINVTPRGNILEFATIYYLCNKSTQNDECPEWNEFNLEIVSKRQVNMSIKKVMPKILNVDGSISQHFYAFERK
ncbi:MAG TPA: tetratricopeptide repeat protein [Smithellaceae bacterium]|nr:tetratricopeptide repeat protein [Smithellaceae bacterium]HRS88355.1 tetratricopeptide repeat protein [Smithellaceae bacterium]HRV25000.1 tetratricopeptide repeat protein [Smithellaceae bacterium]